MWSSRYCREIERGTQMLLAPDNMTCTDVDAPNLTRLCNIIKPPNHPPRCTPEIQYAVSSLNVKARGLENSFHCCNVYFSRKEKLINRPSATHPSATHPKVLRRRGQL